MRSAAVLTLENGMLADHTLQQLLKTCRLNARFFLSEYNSHRILQCCAMQRISEVHPSSRNTVDQHEQADRDFRRKQAKDRQEVRVQG